MATGTIILPVQAMDLPSTNPAAIDRAETNWRLLFDAATAESGWWQFRMPENYSSAPVAKIQYSMASAISGNVIFKVYVMAVSEGDAADINIESYATANTSATTTVPGTAGYLGGISVALTNADNVAANDFVKIKLERDAATDTATGDAEVVTFTFQYTTT